ncbi:glycerate kinase [Halopenitus sp. H-Gu1]|uniref:glycerate kinase type-2 family protein n=1 Tax=Halopenitus sp. H-Gu1 TaxID=3242697 RepID=UPI00359CF231
MNDEADPATPREGVRIRDRDVHVRSPTHALALDCLTAGIDAAHPRRVVHESIEFEGNVLRIDETEYDLSDYEELVVLGGGKATATVTVELETILGDRITDGVIVTNDPRETDHVQVETASHPVPDEAGVAGGRAVLDRATTCGARTLVLGVITGGASALLPAPAGNIGLPELQETTSALLEAGATIDEINAVRKHLSAIKGGRLAAALGTEAEGSPDVACLLCSDVVGDDPGTIGSGPLVPDETTFEDALDVVDRYDLDVPSMVRDRLDRGVAGEIPETPKPGDPIFDRVSIHLLASSLSACLAARDAASGISGADSNTPTRTDGEAIVLSSRIRGEAAEAAISAAGIAEEIVASGNPIEPPAVVVSGGETTVSVTESGEGGPNQEFALSAALELDVSGVVVAAVDTDGIDGPTEYAGAIVSAETVSADGPITPAEAAHALATNDVTPPLERASATIETGKTGTNVNDLRVIVVPEDAGE